MHRPGLTRRHLFSGALLLAGGYGLVHAVGHRPLPPVESPFLGAAGRTTLEAALEAFLPEGANVSVVAEGVEDFLAKGDPLVAGKLGVALTVLEHTAGTSVVSFSRFSRLDLDRRREVLEGWRTSALGTKRQIADALRRLALFSWYTRTETWPAMGYDGPWVGR